MHKNKDMALKEVFEDLAFEYMQAEEGKLRLTSKDLNAEMQVVSERINDYMRRFEEVQSRK